jgi:hypothetical protein
MNIQKFLEQDIDKQIEKACIWGLRLHFLASDLRTFANEIGSKDLDTLETYHWFNQHFGPGFSAGPGYRSASNENYNNLGYCIRETQSNVLNTTEKKGNLGADLVTGYALGQMLSQGMAGLSTDQFHTKEGGFHCEHNFQVNHIKKLALEKILNNNKIDPKSLVRFVMDLSLVVTVHNSERKDGGSNTNKNIAPFWRYANVGANVLQYTDDGFEDVTNCTINEINSNRWNRNKYFKEFRTRFESIEQDTIEKFREEVYNSTYLKEPCSSTSPVLDEKNLKLLVKNDSAKIAEAFYPDKFKDRWKKGK